MNGIFALGPPFLSSSFPPFLHLLRSYHIPKKMDSVPERELFFPFLNMYEGINWLYSRHPYLNFSDLFWCVLEVCFVEWLSENVVDLVPVKHPHPLWPGALGRAVVEVIQVHVVFGLGIAGIKKK